MSADHEADVPYVYPADEHRIAGTDRPISPACMVTHNPPGKTVVTGLPTARHSALMSRLQGVDEHRTHAVSCGFAGDREDQRTRSARAGSAGRCAAEGRGDGSQVNASR